ncbi:MAG: hypothetical protein FJ267_07075 [Planctomycetes bacterium]|nr:hypothetical protein [Planctomycetota bacterium]
MTTTTTTTGHINTIDSDVDASGLPRMTDDAEYEATFSSLLLEVEGSGSTPRPGTSAAADTAASRAIQTWSFTQEANQHAVEMKRRRSPKSRTVYRMGANTHVKKAFEQLKKKLDDEKTRNKGNIQHLTPHLSEEEFKILKQGIENFRVKIIMDDSITFNELIQMRDTNRIELSKTQAELQKTYIQNGPYDSSYIQTRDKQTDLMLWDSALNAEIIRVRQMSPTGVPSQHAQISSNAGVALRDILDPHTTRGKFTSLNNLTKRVRQDLVAFLTSDGRANDRVKVVKQIKEACIVARAAVKKEKEAAVAAADAEH